MVLIASIPNRLAPSPTAAPVKLKEKSDTYFLTDLEVYTHFCPYVNEFKYFYIFWKGKGTKILYTR